MNDRKIERLKWRSRRGLLELDLLFERFWAKYTPELSDRDAQILDRVLQLADNDLLDMVMDRRACADADMRIMMQRLQEG
ncbi:MAG: succinate dehydrogenase assembly factor 2 [Burkholderiales bacterium]|nr:succinate dehydrogenase assembly factor 2 [Burkholderiales bacterium]